MNHHSAAPTGHHVKAQGRAKRRPGYAVPHLFQALKGRNIAANAREIVFMSLGSAPSGWEFILTIEPWALPWVIASRPVGALMGTFHSSRSESFPSPERA